MTTRAQFTLLDRILRDWPRALAPINKQSVKSNRMVHNGLKTSKKFLVDNVTAWINGKKDAGQSIDLKDIPVMVPPFADTWLEYNAIAHLREPDIKKIGVLVWSDKADTGWAITALIFYSIKGAAVISPLLFTMNVDKQGTPDWEHYSIQTQSQLSPDIKTDEAISAIIWMLSPVLFALSLMSCKNVKPAKHLGTQPSAGERRVRKRPYYMYYVLGIEPMQKIVEKTMATYKTDLKLALHICRGHFKDYRKSGLFGKIPGVFWWDPHSRGSSKVGVVDKDYEIEGVK